MAGFAQEVTVADAVITAVVDSALVVELHFGEAAVAVVRARTRLAFAGPASALSRESLHRIGKRHPLSFFIANRPGPGKRSPSTFQVRIISHRHTSCTNDYPLNVWPTILAASSKGTAAEKW